MSIPKGTTLRRGKKRKFFLVCGGNHKGIYIDSKGLATVRRHSLAHYCGIETGDIITSIIVHGGQGEDNTPRDVRHALASTSTKLLEVQVIRRIKMYDRIGEARYRQWTYEYVRVVQALG
ncbi:hypothetical protein AC1031_003015 [Aphanomyces cochlioides]|nr:hypothetical protein AC1031_003015 [Aphanomyces cochlioides]